MKSGGGLGAGPARHRRIPECTGGNDLGRGRGGPLVKGLDHDPDTGKTISSRGQVLHHCIKFCSVSERFCGLVMPMSFVLGVHLMEYLSHNLTPTSLAAGEEVGACVGWVEAGLRGHVTEGGLAGCGCGVCGCVACVCWGGVGGGLLFISQYASHDCLNVGF